METLMKLIDYGQSYWLDNLSRKMIKSGELKKRVTKEGLKGMTSNPSIFNKSISKSSDYDAQIKKLVKERKNISQIYEELTVKDVQDACDIFKQVYDESGGLDGFVSLEVSPYLAHDTEGSMNEARRLFKKVDRKNCFIKIPGTKEGVPAIEEMLYEGVNINITLLFSIESYEAVAHAYVNALERRLNEGKDIKKLSSVASFFLSRIDVLTDQLLGHLIIPETTEDKVSPESLIGKTAVANAKLAYQSFKRIFSGDRWQKLADNGASVQRPLWASTSAKDPLYRDVKYVEPLIGPETVNTLPEATIAAFADHGIIEENAVEKNLNEARKIFEDLKAVGIDLDFVTHQLINEGIQKFIDPYDNLMKTIADKRHKILKGKITTQEINYAESKSSVKAAFGSLDEKQFARRLYSRDPYLWKSDPDQVKSIRNRLGWLDIAQFVNKIDEIVDFANEIKDEKFKFVVLFGMGGSSLCPEVARETFGTKRSYPELFVLDNTDPAAIDNVESKIDISNTLFIVASKSGTTVETLSFYKYFYEKAENSGKQFIAITDSGTSLYDEAKKRNFRKVFTNPDDFGGRYSALSYFGLVPMALIGIDIKSLLYNAHQMEISSGAFIPSEVNPAVSLGVLLGINHNLGRNKVTFVLSSSISAFGYWVEQLIAESTGKENLGMLPVEGESLGQPSAYGSDRVFVYLHSGNDEKQKDERKLSALEKAGHPVVHIELKNKLELGAEFFKWELATAAAGKVIGINPFDEPNVSESKKNTKDILTAWQERNSFGEEEPVLSSGNISIFAENSSDWFSKTSHKSLKGFLSSFAKLAKPNNYFSLLAYFLQTPSRQKYLQSIRMNLRNKFKTAATIGYGPRYMHSTGQLHKGGPNTGIFLVFTYEPENDISIPGKEYGFGTLHKAQALGDFKSLNNHNRRIIRIHLGKDIEGGLKKIVESIK